jgi:hypothetical protein
LLHQHFDALICSDGGGNRHCRARHRYHQYVTEREAPPNWGFEYWQDDPYGDDGWFGREQVTEPTTVDQVPDRPRSQPANIVPDEPHAAPREVARTPPPPTRRPASPTVNTWTANGQLRASNSSGLTFKTPPRPWYHTKQATIALIAAASAALAVPVVLLVLPSSPATDPSTSTSVAPQPSTSAQPTPSSAQPTPINAFPLAPPPPPPPPPTEDTGSAPADSQPYWTRPASPPTEKPDIGVTRTPATRAPISVAPVPRQPSESNSSTPGDGRKRGCGGWC